MPTLTSFTTPWHSSVAYNLDGTVTTGPRCDFDKNETYELIYEHGRPSYYREKSDLFHWAEKRGGVICEPMYPSGWMIKPAKGKWALTIEDVDAQKVRALSEINSPVVLRDFIKLPSKDKLAAKAEEFGTPTPWKFGLILSVKDHGADTKGLNNVLSSEWMPFHYDGLFKTVKQTNENGEESLVSIPPRYVPLHSRFMINISVTNRSHFRFQLFVGATSSPRDTGFTLFSSSTFFHKYLPEWLTPDLLASLKWTVSTSSFDSTVLSGIPMITPHPTTAQPCLRFHEPWPQSKTQFEATNITIDDHSEADSTVICDAITSVLHDRRVAYYHIWEKGDIVVSDNILMMHTRSDFVSGSERELWRIHFD